MYHADYDPAGCRLELSKNGAPWFSIPASFSVNGTVYEPESFHRKGDTLLFQTASSCLSFRLLPDSILVDVSLLCPRETPVYETVYFLGAQGGMDIGHFDRAFCPQPRRNNGHNMDFFRNLPDCSLNGYFYPGIQNFALGNRQGWAAFGLLDLPDSYHYLLREDFSILVESCGGNKVIPPGGTYRPPQMLITFPQGEWESISLFRQKLIDHGRYTPQKPEASAMPSWWRDPLVCTYGDELSTLNIPDVKMNGPEFNADWVRQLVDVAERDWGIAHMNLVLDAFWQVQFALDPVADASRFGDIRAFNEEMHARGHHVIAWITPVFDSVANGFEPLSRKMDVLSHTAIAPLGVEGCYVLDFTADNIETYFEQVCRKLFGDGEGEYHFDGVKLDYMALLRNPAKCGGYRHPERGLGLREMVLCQKTFYTAAKKVRSDVLVNCSVTDPRAEAYLDMNRLHDTHAGTLEKEFRARVATLACPELPIDSDGALMLTDWAKHHYLCAAIYATPANYYTLKYHDKPMPPEELKPMGTLLQAAALRPDGHGFMVSPGNWLLVNSAGRINGRSIDGHTLIYYPWERNPKGYLFTWRNETVTIPLEGRKFGKLTPEAPGTQVDYARDLVLVRLKPGLLYTFESVDEGNSISTLFSRRAQNREEISYENQ